MSSMLQKLGLEFNPFEPSAGGAGAGDIEQLPFRTVGVQAELQAFGEAPCSHRDPVGRTENLVPIVTAFHEMSGLTAG